MQIINNVIDFIYSIYQDVIYPLNKHSLLFYSIYFFIFFFIYFIHTSKTSINIFSTYIEKYKNNKKFLKIFYGITGSIFILLIGGIIYLFNRFYSCIFQYKLQLFHFNLLL